MAGKKSAYKFNSVSPLSHTIIITVFAIYGLICVLPILLLLVVSLTGQSDIMADGYTYFPKTFTLQSYMFLLKDPMMIGRAYLITIGTTFCGVVLNVAVSSMYAYALSRPDYRFKRFFMMLIVVAMVFNGGIPAFYYVYTVLLKLKNSLLALLLPGLCNGFYIIIMRTFFTQNIPNEIVESARIDGSSEANAFFRIVLPISLPILATVAIFTALFYWNDFFNSMLFIENSKLYNLQYTMQRAILNLEFLRTQINMSPAATMMIGRSLKDMPTESVRMAMVVIGVGPVIMVYPFFQRYFVSGLTIGSVKS